MSLIKTLEQKLKEQLANQAASVARAKKWFIDSLKKLSGNELLGMDRARLIPKGQLGVRHIGRMIMFYYNPKLRDTLPFYDRFPLVIVVKFYKDGFLGLNLHYLPIPLRAKLLQGLYSIYINRQFNENTKLNLTYQDLKNKSSTRYFKPCVKRYLYNDPNGGGVKSQFYVVDPNEWDMVLTLPTERFEKKDASYVWEDSKKKINKKQS